MPETANNMIIDTIYEEVTRAYEQGPKLRDLGLYVRSAFWQAQRHRDDIGVTEVLHRSLRARNSQYDPEDKQKLADGIDVYMGITETKCRALESWIGDILANAEDKPWTLRPTPKPALPDSIKEVVVDELVKEIQELGINNVNVQDRLRELKAFADKHMVGVSAKAAERMETLINDQLTEGGWRETFQDFIGDMSTFPNAFIGGPYFVMQKRLQWNGDELVEVNRPTLGTQRISPFDVYPSPDSTTPQDGSYVCLMHHMLGDNLFDSIGLPGFDEAAIRHILTTYPSGFNNWVMSDRQRELDQGMDRLDTDDTTPNYAVVSYHGKISGKMLRNYGLDVEVARWHEAEVWVVDNIVIRAMVNPHPLGRRPIATSSFVKRPGTFWGRSLPQILRDVQRVANATARALVRNVAFSSGPIAEIETDRLEGEDTNLRHIEPYRIFHTNSDAINANRPAINFNQVNSTAPQLTATYDRFVKEADDISGIPAYVLGNPNVAGAGRTLGGLSLLMGNAAKGVKRVISNIDKDVIEEITSAMYTFNMLFHPDRGLKADAQIIARGSAGLLQRELSQARTVEVLAVLTPYFQTGIVPSEGLTNLLRDIVKSMGYDPDLVIPDQERAAEIAGALGQPSTTPGTPGPQLDGRSQPPAGTLPAPSPASPLGAAQGA